MSTIKGRIYRVTYRSSNKKASKYYASRMQAERFANSLKVKYLIEPIEINALTTDCLFDKELTKANMFSVKLLRVIS
jgi:hypothetical protein